MQRQSPPKHRHDGTSPLPLGVDWSPPPRNWTGKETSLPHDPHTGWCYFVTIPSWISLAKSRDSDPVVFYRIFVGIQSPEGVTTTRNLLRRFNDFLKLHDVLKRSFPKKNIPSPPPKGLLRMKTKSMLEERRISLEEWMTRLLSDIDLSRSMAAASFLELEAAARLSFQEDGKPRSDSHGSVNTSDFSSYGHPHSSISVAGSSNLVSENGSDTAYETSDIGSPSLGIDNISEVGTEDLSLYEDINSPVDKFVKFGISNIDEGLSMGQAILEKIESFPKHKMDHIMHNGNYKASEHAEDDLDVPSERNGGKSNLHIRRMSNESIGSDKSSHRGNSFPNGLGPLLFQSDTDVRTSSAADSDDKLTGDMQMVLPMDQRQMVNRILATVQRRLVNAKTDMEDLASRLSQEIAVKEYLASKVKDLEVELDTMKQKSKENLEHAIFVERERMTQMQWKMEELRQKSMELELKLSSKEEQMLSSQSMYISGNQEKDALIQKLDSATQNYENLLKQHQELEGKFKSDMRVLVKEVKSLRGTQADLKQQVSQLAKEKVEAEERFHEEQKKNHETQTRFRKFIHKCKTLHEQLQECDIKNLVSAQGDISSVLEPSDLARTSDDQIGLLIAEAQHLITDKGDRDAEVDEQSSHVDDELRETLYNILVQNGMLRKQVNSLMVHSLEVNQLQPLEKGDIEPHPDVDVNHVV